MNLFMNFNNENKKRYKRNNKIFNRLSAFNFKERFLNKMFIYKNYNTIRKC